VHTPLALRRRFLVIGAALIAATLLTAGCVQIQAAAAAEILAATTAYDSATTMFHTEQAATETELQEAREDVRSAQNTLNTSSGKVLDQVARDTLATALLEATSQVDAATTKLSIETAWLTAFTAGPRTTSKQFDTATRAIKKRHFDTIVIDVTAEQQAVTAAVLLWQAESQRAEAAAAQQTAAEQTAAKRAEAEQNTAQQAPTARVTTPDALPQPPGAPIPGLSSQPARPSTPRPTPAVPRTSWDVWTTGGQTEVDACKGPVDMTAAYGVPVIGEHWFCGGSDFPTTDGTIITLTGTQAGKWRIGGVAATLNKQTQDTRAIPRGNDLMYQTCRNGSNTTMTFTLLTRVE